MRSARNASLNAALAPKILPDARMSGPDGLAGHPVQVPVQEAHGTGHPTAVTVAGLSRALAGEVAAVVGIRRTVADGGQRRLRCWRWDDDLRQQGQRLPIAVRRVVDLHVHRQLAVALRLYNLQVRDL